MAESEQSWQKLELGSRCLPLVANAGLAFLTAVPHHRVAAAQDCIVESREPHKARQAVSL